MPSKKERPSQSQTLCAIVKAQAELFHDDEGAVFANIAESGHFEFYPVNSTGFKRWLRNQFYQLEGKPPSAQALSDALGTIEGIGQFNGERVKTFVRVGEVYGSLCLDLCDQYWQTVVINENESGLHHYSPVRFIRSKGMLPLPEPSAGRVLLGTAWGGRTAYALNGRTGATLWRDRPARPMSTFSTPAP